MVCDPSESCMVPMPSSNKTIAEETFSVWENAKASLASESSFWEMTPGLWLGSHRAWITQPSGIRWPHYLSSWPETILSQTLSIMSVIPSSNPHQADWDGRETYKAASRGVGHHSSDLAAAASTILWLAPFACRCFHRRQGQVFFSCLETKFPELLCSESSSKNS